MTTAAPAPKPTNDARLRFIQSMAALHHTSLAAIARRARVDYSMVYRVAAGQKTSARVEKIIARELGITRESLRKLETLRRLG